LQLENTQSSKNEPRHTAGSVTILTGGRG